MPTPRKDITGMRFGRLVAVCFAGKVGTHTRWALVCDCGSMVVRYLTNIRSLKASCGCAHASHDGLTYRDRRTWNSYQGMLRRCYDTGHPFYKDYGGRGISVYFDWVGADGFRNFLRDMGSRPEGRTLDRENVDGNYEPGNARWADAVTQRRNQRRMRK